MVVIQEAKVNGPITDMGPEAEDGGGSLYHPRASLIRFIVSVVIISVTIASPACLIVRRAS
jgi:hypothetical protein